MQIQKKNSNSSKPSIDVVFKPRKYLRSRFYRKTLKFLRLNIVKSKRLKVLFKPNSAVDSSTEVLPNIRYLLTITVRSNNMFCNLVDVFKKRTLISLSAGQISIRISRKAVKFGHKLMIQQILSRVKPYLIKKTVVIKLSAPIRIRRSIIKLMKKALKTRIVFILKAIRCFNGCRPRKMRRTRPKGFRAFKYNRS
jgi:ribosomal protein S11